MSFQLEAHETAAVFALYAMERATNPAIHPELAIVNATERYVGARDEARTLLTTASGARRLEENGITHHVRLIDDRIMVEGR